MTQYIKKLPAIFQTVTEKKFFDATFDQVFSKKDSDLLAGYIGRRVPGLYNPISDFYLPEPNKNRTWWQLEATAFARNKDSTKSNIFFYEDLLDSIEYYGGNTLNQDRLFESEYYSFAPPIDYDMFINYQNYYWVETGLPTITITGVLSSDIIGNVTYTTPPTAIPANFTLSSGMTVILASDPNYLTPHVIENFGGCNGIQLVEQFSDITAGTISEFLAWDSDMPLSNGRIIRNAQWDSNTWDTQSQPGAGDYITIERGSNDKNAWSRTNKWFHLDTINAVVMATGTSFPSSSTRALRAIIQFNANLDLYQSGTQFRDTIAYGLRDKSNGDTLLLADIQAQSVSTLISTYNLHITTGDLVCFFDDTSFVTANYYPWGNFPWDNGQYDTGTVTTVNQYIYQANILLDNTVIFTPYTSYATPVLNGDIVITEKDAPYNGAQSGQTWFFTLSSINQGSWSEAVNDKVSVNQPPLFQLYDHNGISLNDPVVYPFSTFAGSKIFSYYVDDTPGATNDPVLGFPIVYTALGQASDILFQNNLITDRYTYSESLIPIDGYYYYVFTPDTTLYNSWNLYNPCQCPNIVATNCNTVSRQRVIDKFVVGYGTEYQFPVSVTPYGYPIDPDIIVSVNGQETTDYTFVTINNKLFVDLTSYLTTLLLTTQKQPPVVELETYTHGNLDPALPGYSEIPQQLEANPSQDEVKLISGSNLIQHFTSIIANQVDFTGTAFGSNNYRDSYKNGSVGSYILQNVTPALKSMLVSSSDDLDFITAERFSQDEYTKFKNRYLSAALRLINQGYTPLQYQSGINADWINQIFKTLNVSKEFSNAFAYSYMVAAGNPTFYEVFAAPGDSLLTLDYTFDISDTKNIVYIYDTSVIDATTLLIVGRDYTLIQTTSGVDIQLTMGSQMVGIAVYVYKDALPTYVPSTPSKLGMYNVYIPRIEVDHSYTIPTSVIIGHDGSKTITFGDYRDDLLLDLEKRIYNNIQSKYRDEYQLPIEIESVKSGYFRTTRYSRDDYLAITVSYLNKWCAKYSANYRVNDWISASGDLPNNSPELWKLYNYSSAVNTSGVHLNLPGNWKGIFQYYYDTIYPNTRPWEMLGFSSMPSWWTDTYGAPSILGFESVYPFSPTYSFMWSDIENGIIRYGSRAIYDPVTELPQIQPMWERPGLSSIMPVDSVGAIRTIASIFSLITSGNAYAPFQGFDDEWKYGDGGPVEQAWMSTSGYIYSLQEFMYLMRPAPYGEFMFDTLGTELSPGMIEIVGISGKVQSSVNPQYVQNDIYTDGDAFFRWMRPKNSTQTVHAELVDNVPTLRFGYQTWISDRILFLGKNIADTFGHKVRTLDVNLANKLAGFTNKDTTNAYIESVTPGASTNTLIIPSTNFEVKLHKSPSIKTYSYSGAIIRALSDGTFVVYGYDLLSSQFIVLDRSTDKLIDVSVGGTPEGFRTFVNGSTYAAGEIVRYNGVYYRSLAIQTVAMFSSGNWLKLASLPVDGGVSVSYKPNSTGTLSSVPYGTIFNTVQEVFDFLIGWGDYLASQGWQFDNVDANTNQVSDWLYSGKQFLFWLNTNWAPDASIQLSPLANSATLIVEQGYPSDVETLSNGIYSILDKFGVAIPVNQTVTERDGKSITVSPANDSVGGIFFIQVNVTETEHILIFDNITNFNDVVYAPLLRARQQRLRFNGFRSNGWYGKMEAPGYLVMNDQMVPNFDTIVESMRYFYEPNITIDNPSLEDLGRHLIGYESKSYLDNLQVSNDVQYLFYKGAIRQKGTSQAFDKLFRSTKIQSNDIIKVYEEWALKLGSFGNTIEQVSTEFKLKPEQNTGNVIVARLNYVPSAWGFVKEIKILNAVDRYNSVPTVVISAPDSTSPNNRQAKAYAILDASKNVSRIDIIDRGYGYLTAPTVTITGSTQDIVYAVWQGEILNDPTLDNIIDIDIDDTAVWTVRPPEPSISLVFPTTTNIVYPTPNAGYVNSADVTFLTFDPIQAAVLWGSSNFNPMKDNTVWVAKTFTEDWDVYKLFDITADSDYIVTKDTVGDLYLKTASSYLITPQLSGGAHDTDFGNMIILQGMDMNNVIPTQINYTVGFQFDSARTLSENDGYNWYSLLTLDGNPITVSDIPTYDGFNAASLPTTPVNYTGYAKLMVFKTMRFLTTQTLPSYVTMGDKVWVDQIGTDKHWVVYKYDGVDLTTSAIYRQQAPLINTRLFENASAFADSAAELVQLPVYDPFKNILPGPAKQNISYMTLRDPARYNVTGNDRLFSSNIVFGEQQVGKLWWDLSNVRYMYYEQPRTVDPLDETDLQNLVYIRDNWGQIFPGSTIDIYEWVKSSVPPAQYTGTGTPRDITSYVQITTSNTFTSATEINYYFWVLNTTDKPNVENRTMAASDVASMLRSPRSQGYAFFAPAQQTPIYNAYIFYNVQEILAYKGDNIQVQYRVAERDDQEHTEWAFYREGDTNSLVSDQFWNKMVDSLCGYTGLLPDTGEFKNRIIVASAAEWESVQWDMSGWDEQNSFNEILAVPDPSLSLQEAYGIQYRPLQSMFVNLTAARKVFVQAANSLLKHIPVKDDIPGWEELVSPSEYWSYTNWYAVGYEDVTPTVMFADLIDATSAVTAGELQVGTILQVVNGTADGRYVMYVVEQLDPNVPTLSLKEVAIQNSAVKILDTVYTTFNKYSLSQNLREMLVAMRTKVMINNFIVDQNELFFSMLNYVVSEQKNPNWLFKSSYIYIKEDNLPLTQDQLYVPDQITNIMDYIIDAKPYHTQIRDYTSTYITADTSPGTASDFFNFAIIDQFGPNYAGAAYTVPVTTIGGTILTPTSVQSISQESIYTVPLTFFDVSKVGLSNLFPYTFTALEIGSPTWVPPSYIVGVQIGATVLVSTQDFYTEYNNDNTYTIYFYNNPGSSPVPVAMIWIDGGSISIIDHDVYRNETADGINSADDIVILSDTRLPVNTSTGVPTPYVGFGDVWDAIADPVVSGILVSAGGTASIPWDAILTLTVRTDTISSRENLNIYDGADFYRNSNEWSGTLSVAITAPTAATNNLDIITVLDTSGNLPNPTPLVPGVIWVEGERIEYDIRVPSGVNTWQLKNVARGTMGTSAVAHAVGKKVFYELYNSMPAGANDIPWNMATNTMTPDPASPTTKILDVPLGGLWYSGTDEANFLKASLGSIPLP